MKASGKHRYDVCDMNFENPSGKKKHCEGQKHKTCVAAAEKKNVDRAVDEKRRKQIRWADDAYGCREREP
jgi:hypothetical protein